MGLQGGAQYEKEAEPVRRQEDQRRIWGDRLQASSELRRRVPVRDKKKKKPAGAGEDSEPGKGLLGLRILIATSSF